MRGTYFLLLRAKKDCKVIVGARGFAEFSKGYYVYVGSAMKNIEMRVFRHLKRAKKKHWHIDYLTTNKNFEVVSVWYKESSVKRECFYSKKLERDFEFLAGFGCSDCNCDSHLYKVSLMKFKEFIRMNKLKEMKI